MDVEIQCITKDVVDRLFDLLGDKLDRVILFGSYARGDFTPESDIDIMVILNCSEEELRQYKKQVIHLASETSLDHEKLVSLMLRDKNSFERKKTIYALYKNILNDGVVLYG